MSKILTKNNIQNDIVHNIHDNGELFVIFWPNLDQPLPKNCIIYNFDPMVPNVIKELFGIIGDRKDVTIWDYCYSQKNYDILKCFKYQILPYGISEFNEIVDDIPKDIDVLFFGGLNDRRREIFVKFNNDNPKLKVCLKFNNLYDDIERKSFIKRSKIVLSICSNDALSCCTNDLARLSEVISNKTFIIAESIGDKMFESLSGITFLDNIDNLTKYVKYYIDRPEKDIISENTFKNCKKYFNFDEELISCIKQHI